VDKLCLLLFEQLDITRRRQRDWVKAEHL